MNDIVNFAQLLVCQKGTSIIHRFCFVLSFQLLKDVYKYGVCF